MRVFAIILAFVGSCFHLVSAADWCVVPSFAILDANEAGTSSAGTLRIALFNFRRYTQVSIPQDIGS